jgi:hypothetical protein
MDAFLLDFLLVGMYHVIRLLLWFAFSEVLFVCFIIVRCEMRSGAWVRFESVLRWLKLNLCEIYFCMRIYIWIKYLDRF